MSKVIGSGWGKCKRKFMQKRLTEKRNRTKKKRRKKFCRVNCTVGLTDSKRLNGNLTATLYCSFNFLVLVSPHLPGFF